MRSCRDKGNVHDRRRAVLRGRLGVLLLVLLSSPTALLADDEQTLRHMKTVLWPQAYRTQDVELLDRILHDSFQMIDADGNRSTKARELDRIRESPWDPGRFEYRIERLDVFMDSLAVIDGTGIAESYTYKSSNILIKEDGQWRAVASHVSGFRETP